MRVDINIAPCLVIAVLWTTSCRDTLLSRTDAGFLDDAGPRFDAGIELDAGNRFDAGLDVDAGFDGENPSDGGFVDGGNTVDAGLVSEICSFGAVPPFTFECEGDEDFCSPEPSPQTIPQLDIVASWSRIENNNAIIEVRLRQHIWTAERTEMRLCLGWRLEASIEPLPASGGLPLIPYSPDPWICPGGVIFLGSVRPWRLPPDVSASVHPSSSPIEPCDLHVSTQEPVISFTIPITEFDHLEYTILTRKATNSDYDWDITTYDTEIIFLDSLGGSSNEASNISICDLTCALAAEGREQ